MAALTAAANVFHKGTPTKIALQCTAADTFYEGAICYIDVSNNTGQIQVSSLAATDVFVGICAKTTTTAAQGDLVEVYVDGIHALPVSSVAATDVGSFVIADVTGTWTDNPADLVMLVDTTEAANDVLIGQAIGMDPEETAHVWVRLDPGWIWDATNTTWKAPIT